MTRVPFRGFHGIPKKHSIVWVTKKWRITKCAAQVSAGNRIDSRNNAAEEGKIKWQSNFMKAGEAFLEKQNDLLYTIQ